MPSAERRPHTQHADLGNLHLPLKRPVRSQEIKLIAITVSSMPKASGRKGLSRSLVFVILQVVTVQVLGADLPIKQYFSCEGNKSSSFQNYGEEKDSHSYKNKESMVFFRYNVAPMERKIKGILDFADSGKFEVCFEEVHTIFFHRHCLHNWPEHLAISNWYNVGRFDKVTGSVTHYSHISYKKLAEKGNGEMEFKTESLTYQCEAVSEPVVK
jgi:hypothetical protein